MVREPEQQTHCRLVWALWWWPRGGPWDHRVGGLTQPGRSGKAAWKGRGQHRLLEAPLEAQPGGQGEEGSFRVEVKRNMHTRTWGWGAPGPWGLRLWPGVGEGCGEVLVRTLAHPEPPGCGQWRLRLSKMTDGVTQKSPRDQFQVPQLSGLWPG